MDAKYTQLEKVKQHQYSSLVFKYLYSITALNTQDSISGLCIICGKGTSMTNPFNPKDVEEKLEIVSRGPYSDILILNERIDDLEVNHKNSMDVVFSKYLKRMTN